MHAHVLQHVPFEGLGSIEPWLRKQDARVDFTRFFDSPALPNLDGINLVVAMGGPMSVNDEAILPWLIEEKRFLREAIQRGIPVLGICLGAQLIAAALGARVYPGAHREIGWFEIERTSPPGSSFTFPEKSEVFHWHGETFDLPSGSLRLARSMACENQAFQLGSHVIGLQFHLETTPGSARALVDHCGDELIPGKFAQSAESILSKPAESYARINELMEQVLTYLAGSKT